LKFIRRTNIEAPAELLFAWHQRPGAFERLTPAFENVDVVERIGTIENGDRITVKVGMLGPIKIEWQLEHSDYIAGAQFRDSGIRGGPFSSWSHLHKMIPEGETSVLEDSIEYALPLHPFSAIAHRFVASKLDRLFDYRHAVTAHDLSVLNRNKEAKPMKILVSGASGFVASHLIPMLTTQGHEVHKLVRKDGGPGTIMWDPASGAIEAEKLEGFDAVIHLAGQPVAERWTAENKRKIEESRIKGTQLLCNTLAALQSPPAVLVCASAIGYYGDRQDELLTEESASGTGFLPRVCEGWELATKAASEKGIRVVNARIGIVLSPDGGVMARLLPPFQMGAGGPLGNGHQFMAWIAIDDAIHSLLYAITNENIVGPMNVVSPNPVRNSEFTKVLGKVLHRPTIFPVPVSVAHIAFGKDMADELFFASNRVIPKKLMDNGFEFKYGDLEKALKHLLGK
jgi:uncharacterized protein